VAPWSISSPSLLRAEEALLLDVSTVVVLLEGGEPGAAVVLGTTAALLIAEVLAGIRREETWCDGILVT
jgi:hypothetical protein